MKRLYFLIPDIKNAMQIVSALQEMGVGKDDMHVVIKDQNKLDMTKVLEAGVLEKTDVLNALVKGAIFGGIAGLITGLLIVKFPPEEFILGTGTVVGLSIFGILFGAWASSLVGISIPHPVVRKLERAVEAGGIMMLVDIPKHKESEILQFIRDYHPETTIHGAQLLPKSSAE